MTPQVITHRQFRSDMRQAYNWYDSQRDGLGDEFVMRVYETIDAILDFPEMHPVIYTSVSGRAIRQAAIIRFPYRLFYVVEDDGIMAIAVLHTRRSLITLIGRL